MRGFIAAILLSTAPGWADDKAFRLAAPPVLTETGFLKYLLPRFSLKTGIRITLAQDESAAILGDTGTAVFRDAATLWHIATDNDPDAQAFEDWLVSDIGKRTITGFTQDGAALFSIDIARQAAAVATQITGDAAKGADLSMALCGRCHVISTANRMDGLGSTPSFALLRGLANWEARFSAFFALNPHPSFTQIADVTPAFDPRHPPPIAPVELDLDDLDAIMAFVAGIEPADLGAPIQPQ